MVGFGIREEFKIIASCEVAPGIVCQVFVGQHNVIGTKQTTLEAELVSESYVLSIDESDTKYVKTH